LDNFENLLDMDSEKKAKRIVQPVKVPKIVSKSCKKCGEYYRQDMYYPSNSFFFPDGYCDICKDCLDTYLGDGRDLEKFDKVCQYLDVPFDLNEWMNIVDHNPAGYLNLYMRSNWSKAYETGADWKKTEEEWRRIIKENKEKEKLDVFNQEEMQRLIAKWGNGFSKQQMIKFEQMYEDIERTQSITTAIQRDNAKKMCMLSYKIEEAIWNEDENGRGNGTEVKSLIGAYDQLAKSADFTPKAAKNIGDFESVGELCAFLEKRGFKNDFYDWKPKDEVDKVMANLQKYTRRVILGETNIADELNSKLDQIQAMNAIENGEMEEEENYHRVPIEDDLADEYNEEMEI
jgi:hypothetical protein